MKTIVFDLEMNQPSGRIIEIGAVKVDLKNHRIEDKFQMFCALDEPLNPEITELTGITEEMLEKAPSFDKSCQKFWHWVEASGCGKRLSAWGGDLHILTEQSIKADIKVPDKIREYDVHKIAEVFRFAADIPRKHRGGLRASMEAFQISFEGKQHRALDDAIATAKLFIYLFQMIRKSFAVESLYTNKAQAKPEL